MSNSNPVPSDRLSDYRAKRSAGATPEPFGAAGERPRLFVIQKHAATRLHYDFRIEWGGTLWSWAVPRGPSFNPRENRLAVHVEDHPVEYADFEGVIPEGNYGAGSVIVWDMGLWVPLDDPDEGLERGRIHFELRGYKMRGIWLLLRPQPDTKDWFLKKKTDAYSTTGGDEPFTEESIFSGLTVEEVRDGRDKAEALKTELAEEGVPEVAVTAKQVDLMLAKSVDEPFSSPDWLFELKYDGYRLLAERDADGNPFLRSRNGHDLTDIFPEIARALRAHPYERLVIDGELVVLDEASRPSFQRLQGRSQLRNRRDIERATVEQPATMFAFDLLGLEGHDLRSLPLTRRKELLARLLPRSGPIRYSDHVVERGEDMFAQVEAMELEGMIAKDAVAPYKGGRSDRWLKIVVQRTADFVVCGYTEPQGSRVGFGALHLGIYEGGTLVYAGRAGTGFSDEQLREYHEALETIQVDEPPCERAPTGGQHRWVKPALVVEVKYKEFTDDGHLRAPVFLRFRTDKLPDECTRAGDLERTVELVEQPVVEEEVEQKEIRFTNLDKVFWPEESYTKGDLIDYYRSVSPWLLPFLIDRPLVLTRYPDGIEGKSFYQKNVPDYTPRWVRTVGIWSEHTQREIDYFVCDDLETLLYVINSGAIPLHVWSSRVATLQNPDWCLIDLDPKEAPFEHVVTLALAIHELCTSIELDSFVKTTGSSGLHVLIPLGGQCTYEQSRQLGQLISRVMEAEHTEIATMTRVIGDRQGKVYLDYLQNRHGQLLVSPYSVRPFPAAPVSAPLEWSEVGAELTPRQYTIANLGERLAAPDDDPNLAVLSKKPDLLAALSKLAVRIEAIS